MPYESEYTVFLRDQLKQHPEWAEDQLVGRALLWDTKIDLDEQARLRRIGRIDRAVEMQHDAVVALEPDALPGIAPALSKSVVERLLKGSGAFNHAVQARTKKGLAADLKQIFGR